MTARVTGNDVRDIISTELHTEAFIDVAHLIVDENLVGKGMSEARLTQIEKWLAAHFVAVADPRAVSEGIGQANINYGQQLGKYLDATIYGQQVKILDTSNTLINLGKVPARIVVVSEAPDPFWR